MLALLDCRYIGFEKHLINAYGGQLVSPQSKNTFLQ